MRFDGGRVMVLDPMDLPIQGLWERPIFAEVTPMGVSKVTISVVVAYWAAVSAPMQVLLVVMLVDYMTGLAAAFILREASSDKGLRGLLKKMLIILPLILCQYVEAKLGINTGIDKVGAVAYIINEMVSIIENLARCGVPIPVTMVERLLKVRVFRQATKEELERFRNRDYDAR